MDHIVPAHSCPDLFWNEENWAAMCLGCHGLKTRKEPQQQWEPREDRIVLCGLPGTGKTTAARKIGGPIWDADDHPELQSAEEIIAARDRWIDSQHHECVVIVASITSASQIAAKLQGVVRHMTHRYVDRESKKSLKI